MPRAPAGAYVGARLPLPPEPLPALRTVSLVRLSHPTSASRSLAASRRRRDDERRLPSCLDDHCSHPTDIAQSMTTRKPNPCNVSLSAIACAIDIYKFAFAIDMAINIGH